MFIKATEADRAALLAYCGREPHANLFLIADIQNFGFGQPFQQVWKQLAADGGLVGVLLRYYENYLYYSHSEGPHVAEAGQQLAAQDAKLVSAKPALLGSIRPALHGRFEQHDRLLCTLERTDALLPDPEGLMEATVDDATELAAAYQQIEEFHSLYLGGVGTLAETIRNRIASGEGRHWFLRRKGRVACHANTTAETEKSGVVGGVFTLPAWRKQGLAAGIVSAACRSLLGRGKTPALFFDNPEAGRMYYKLGFVHTGAWGSLEQAAPNTETE